MLRKKSLDARSQMEMNVLDDLVPRNHLVRQLDEFLDLSFVYDILKDAYCPDNGRPSVDPVVLVKIAIIKKMFGISSLRKTLREIEVNAAYRWYLGYGFSEKIPHFTTYVKHYAKRFGDNNFFQCFFEQIIETALDKKLVDPEVLFIDGSHVKASANKNKRHKDLIEQEALLYQEEMDASVNEIRSELGKKPLKKKKSHRLR